jgi:F0F1-type ATP synthase assembly protein I
MEEKPIKQIDAKTYQKVVLLVTGQVGCATVLIIVVALVLGLLLDRQFQTRPILTLVTMLLSIPVSIATTLWILRSVLSRYQVAGSEKKLKVDSDLEKEVSGIGRDE